MTDQQWPDEEGGPEAAAGLRSDTGVSGAPPDPPEPRGGTDISDPAGAVTQEPADGSRPPNTQPANMPRRSGAPGGA